MAELIKHTPEIYKSGGISSTPAPTHLYEVRDPESNEAGLLNTKEKSEYHTITAQCLYLSKRARPNIQQAVAFHCTRVTRPDKDDQKNLIILISYLRETIYLPLMLCMNDSGISEWLVDASLAIYEDMKSRTGVKFSMGNGAIYSASTKQGIMTSSSTEVELVGVTESMPKIRWY